MTTTTTTATAPEPESEPRIAIWSLSARVIGAYFVIFLLQYAPGVALEAYAHWPQPAPADGATAMEMARAAVTIVKASGPIGIGSATNALAVAIIVEATMVLAKIISMHQREEGFRQGVKHGREQGIEQGVQQGIEQGVQQGVQQGIQQERKRSNARLRALAEKYGIPEADLSIADEDD